LHLETDPPGGGVANPGGPAAVGRVLQQERVFGQAGQGFMGVEGAGRSSPRRAASADISAHNLGGGYPVFWCCREALFARFWRGIGIAIEKGDSWRH